MFSKYGGNQFLTVTFAWPLWNVTSYNRTNTNLIAYASVESVTFPIHIKTNEANEGIIMHMDDEHSISNEDNIAIDVEKDADGASNISEDSYVFTSDESDVEENNFEQDKMN